MKIQDVMCQDVVVCRIDDDLKTVAERMWRADVGCLPVLDGDGNLKGMVTDRDLLMSVAIQGMPLETLGVDSAMAHQVQTLRGRETLEHALDRMAEHQVRRLPVVDDEDHLIGMVSMNDLVRRADQGGKPRPADVLRALAQVCEPRARNRNRSEPQGQPKAVD